MISIKLKKPRYSAFCRVGEAMIEARTLIQEMTEGYAEYLRDESRSLGQAQSISFPKSEEEVIAVVHALHASLIPITVQGGRTGLAAGAVPAGGHILNVSRMNAITGLRQDADGNFYVRVQPGLALSSLRKMLESKKFVGARFDAASRQALRAFLQAPEQFFPTDPTETSATIGGMVACNASGARSYHYGPARPYIEALRMVLSDGQTLALKRGGAKAQGRCLTLQTEQGQALPVPLPAYVLPHTKNASGYFVQDDMEAIDLLIGSDGSLGGITEIELRLLPLPAVMWGVSCFLEREEQAIDLVISVREQIKGIASMEYFDVDALAVLRRQKQQSSAFAQLPEVAEQFAAVVYFELHCESEEEAAARLFAIGDLLLAVGANSENTWVARTAVDLDRLMFFRHAVPEAVNMLIDARKKEHPGLTKLGTDMSVPNQHLRVVMRMYREMLAARGLQSAVWGHIGDNHLHVNILPRDDEDYRQGKELYREWARCITDLGGAVSAEHGVGKLKADFLAIMYGEENVAAMAAVKAALDPLALFGAGNLFAPELVRQSVAKNDSTAAALDGSTQDEEAGV